ncbi:unnamed protein product [Chironomus riparius]|uniref:Uncharacterized protein n=1 Tax=Chironomus riparius TaxID=315576 RepID=A0A9N9RN82_9DIPT|nr:unnamed protein product [Chironomus riparius]
MKHNLSLINYTINVNTRKILQIYMCCELMVWAVLSYASINYGKMFDHRYTNTQQFAQNIDTNIYYVAVFGHLNLTYLDVKEQRIIQEKCYLINTLLVFVWGTYFILSIFFVIGLTKMLSSKCLLCPYITYDLSVIISVIVFVIYGFYEKIEMLDKNGDLFLLLKVVPSALIHLYYHQLTWI